LTGPTGVAWPVKFLPGRSKLITRITRSDGDGGGRSYEWDLKTGRELQSWPLGPFRSSIAASLDEKYYAAIAYENSVWFKSLANGEVTETNLNFLESDAAALSSDGRLLAVGSNLGYARVWDTTTWQQVADLRGFNAIHSLAFTADGKRLAVASGRQETVKLWDTTWQSVLTLQGQVSTFIDTQFSPDGNAIGSLNRTGTLHIWRAPSWAEIDAAEAKNKMTAQTP
jgi:WD40 repeat protein